MMQRLPLRLLLVVADVIAYFASTNVATRIAPTEVTVVDAGPAHVDVVAAPLMERERDTRESTRTSDSV